MPVKEKTKPAKTSKFAKASARGPVGMFAKGPAKKPHAKPAKTAKKKPAAPPLERIAPTPPVLIPSIIYTTPVELDAHPAAEVLPLMGDDEFAALKTQIQAEGILQPIVLCDGQILDGRHRHRAWRELLESGITTTETGRPLTLTAVHFTGDSPFSFVVAVAHHRNLSDTQKACAAVGVLPRLEEEADLRRQATLKQNASRILVATRDGMTEDEYNDHLECIDPGELKSLYRQHVPKGNASSPLMMRCEILDALFPARTPDSFNVSGRSRDLAANLFGCSPAYVQTAKFIVENDRDLFTQCFSGKSTATEKPMTLTRARALVQRALATKALADTISRIKESGIKLGGNWDVIEGDCLEQLPLLPVREARLIVTDPPYNEGVDYGDGFDDARPDDEYLAWCEDWIGKCSRALADDGSIFLICSARYSDQIGMLMRAHNLHRRNCIAWAEEFGNYTEANFSTCWRAIHYYTRHASKFTWNKHAGRVRSWRQDNGDSRAVQDGKVPSNVWSFPRVVGNHTDRLAGFPTQLPVELVERIILMASDPGDLVVDPFNGSGTTGVAAIRHSRRYIGIERKEAYVQAARARLAEIIPMID